MRESEAKEIVAMLVGAYPHPPLPPSTVGVYAMALADLDYGDAKAAVMRMCCTAKWLPKISEIREEVARGRVKLPSPEEAWGIVRRAVGKHGSYRVPIFDCEEIHGAVEDIGWKTICLAQEGDASTRSRFCEAFKSRAARRYHAEVTGDRVPPERQIPPHEPEIGDVRVLAETGYPTARLVHDLRLESARDDEMTDDVRMIIEGAAKKLRAPEEPS